MADVNLNGKDLWQFGRSLVEHFRELLLKALGSNQETGFTTEELIKVIETLADATLEVKRSQQSSLPLELALIKLTNPMPVSDLESRIAKLEALLQGNITPVRSTPPPVIETPSHNISTSLNNIKHTESKNPPVQSTEPLINNPLKHWEVFLEVIKKKKRTLAALVQEGKPISFEENELVVGFPPNLKFHLENVKLPNNKALLEGILKNLCGQDLKISFVPLEESAPVAQSHSQESDILKRTVDLFGGEIRPVSKEEK